MNAGDPDLVKALRLQAGVCRTMGSGLNADLLERAADDWLANGPVRTLLAPWARADLKVQFDAAVALRLVAAWHELALSGEDHALSAAYESLEAEAVWAAAQAATTAHHERLIAFMGHEPQTNEVRRSICLVGGFMEIARAAGLPMRCFEIAASAELIAEIGARATPRAPFAWLRLEPPGSAPRMEVRLTLWPGGEEQILAESNTHGAHVHWQGA